MPGDDIPEIQDDLPDPDDVSGDLTLPTYEMAGISSSEDPDDFAIPGAEDTELEDRVTSLEQRLNAIPLPSSFASVFPLVTGTGSTWNELAMVSGSLVPVGTIGSQPRCFTGETVSGAAIIDLIAGQAVVIEMLDPASNVHRYLRISSPGSVTNATGNAMEVLVKVDGGADGDDVTFASWTYTIYNSSDSIFTTPLATGLTLENGAPSARFTVGEVVPAVDGAIGIAQKNGSTWSLLSVDETRVVDVCETDPTFSAGAVSLAMVAPFNLMFAGANAALTGSTSSATVTLTAVTTIGSPTNGLSISGSTLTLSAGLLFTYFSDAGNGTTVETDLYSDTIAAGQLVSNGNVLEIDYGGVYVSSGTATRQIKLYFGGTAIFDTGALTLSLSSAWSLYASIIRVSASVVRYTVSFTTQGATLAAYTASGELTGLTLSGTNILKITGQAAGIGAASNDIVAKMGYINFKP